MQLRSFWGIDMNKIKRYPSIVLAVIIGILSLISFVWFTFALQLVGSIEFIHIIIILASAFIFFMCVRSLKKDLSKKV